MNWDVTIDKVANGYICSWQEEFEDNHHFLQQMVFEDRDDSPDELDSTVDLIHFLLTHFAVQYSKHNARNIVVEIEETAKVRGVLS